MSIDDPASPSSSAATSDTRPGSVSEEKKRILERIALQRERLSQRRATRAQAASAGQAAYSPEGSDSFVWRAVAFAREHPLAVAAATGIALVAGPARLVKWATVVLPIVMRYMPK